MRNEVVVNFANVGHYYGIKVPDEPDPIRNGSFIEGANKNTTGEDEFWAKKGLKDDLLKHGKTWGFLH